MTTPSEALDRLINDWTLIVEVADTDTVRSFPPLVDMLHGQLAPATIGAGGGGAPSTRNVLDIKSLDLLTNIEDVTRAWLQEWRITTSKELKADLRTFWNTLHDLHAAGELDDTTFDHLVTYPDAWATRIWDLIEPPKRVTLRGTECPRCGIAKTENTDGDLSDALTVVFRVGHEPTAECTTNECGAIWIGLTGLMELGRAIGAELDLNMLSKVGNT